MASSSNIVSGGMCVDSYEGGRGRKRGREGGREEGERRERARKGGREGERTFHRIILALVVKPVLCCR